MSGLTRAAGMIVGGVLATAPLAAGATDPVLLYAAEPAASEIHDGLGTSLRQLAALPNHRWNTARRVGRVRGKELANAPTAEAMASQLRAGWRSEKATFVGVDEILPAHWTPDAAGRLRAAVELLGSDAQRVIFYAGPSMVERVGRADPRRPLPNTLGVLVDAMSRGRATYLMTYRGNLQPFPARKMAVHPTRWVARWPANENRLRLMLGPDGGVGQQSLWDSVRSTPAGRQLLDNGPAAYGLRTRAAGGEWLAQYRAFLRSPALSPTGRDAPVPEPGGLALARRSATTVTVAIGRSGRAVVRLVPRGQSRGRVLKALHGPTGGPRNLRLPADLRPGRYTLVAVLEGDGLRDVARLPMLIRRR